MELHIQHEELAEKYLWCYENLPVTGAAAGGSDDWMKAKAGVKYSYTVELPGGGELGFDLPPRQIPFVTKETFEAIKLLGYFIANQGLR